jgi:large subunit ribosomal protein L7/L12
MATLTQDDLLEAIDKMTVLELSEFITRFEERYGVTAAAPVAAAAAPAASGGGDGASGGAAAATEEQTEFSAVLAEVGPNKIPVIKVVRELREK